MSEATVTRPAFKFTVKDPGSALTHFIGAVMAVCATPFLLIRAGRRGDPTAVLSMAVFMLSMILLYTASTTYHTLNINERVNRILRKIDHMMIFVLIAGSYTPVCLITLRDGIGIGLCIAVWAIAVIGMAIKAFWITCPKWFSSVVYIVMGWLCITALPQLLSTLAGGGFGWLLAGGIAYTAGGILYAMKLSLFNHRHPYFGSHEIFHLFVMLGSICHFICMYGYVI